MPRKARAKPKTPEQIAAEKRARLLRERDQDFAAADLPGARLVQQANIHVRRAGRQNVQTARRADAFDALREGMPPGCYDAARRLERDVLIRRGESDGGRTMQRIDGGNGCREDQIVEAGRRVDAVMKHLSPRDGWLLMELIEPGPGRDTWRKVVGYITGEASPHAQAAAVRAACVNLRDAYEHSARRAA